jgi:hypothetical protein
MAKKPVEGHCRVCGAYGQLSQEHVPPKRAFNGMPYIRLDLEQAMALGPDEVPEGPKREGGIRFHTLCRQCNNDFGGWYARAFVEWCYQGMTILQRSDGRPRLVYAHHVYPMRVIKQIITMFFSVNSDQFRKTPIGESLFGCFGIARRKACRAELGSTPTSTGWVGFDITQSQVSQISTRVR